MGRSWSRGEVRRLPSWFRWPRGMHSKHGRSGHSSVSFLTLRVQKWKTCQTDSVAAHGGDWRVSMFLPETWTRSR